MVNFQNNNGKGKVDWGEGDHFPIKPYYYNIILFIDHF